MNSPPAQRWKVTARRDGRAFEFRVTAASKEEALSRVHRGTFRYHVGEDFDEDDETLDVEPVKERDDAAD